MLNEEEFDCITNIASSIKEIHFNKVPNISILEALSEGSDNALFYFPLDKICTLEYAEYNFSSNIAAINLETDVFIDSDNLYNFPNLKKLVLSCSNNKAETLSHDDLDDMRMAIENLEHLEELIFDLHKMKQTAINEVKDFVFFAHKKIKVTFIDHVLGKPKNILKRYL